LPSLPFFYYAFLSSPSIAGAFPAPIPLFRLPEWTPLLSPHFQISRDFLTIRLFTGRRVTRSLLSPRPFSSFTLASFPVPMGAGVGSSPALKKESSHVSCVASSCVGSEPPFLGADTLAFSNFARLYQFVPTL